jgi:hypothetical protein
MALLSHFPTIGSITRLWRQPRGVMDVQNLNYFVRDAINDFVWIPNESRDTNAAAFNNAGCALRPPADARNDNSQALLDRRGNAWIVGLEVSADFIKVISAGSVKTTFIRGEI